MSIGVFLIKNLNRLFRPPVHPFNLQNSGVKSYSRWEYENGAIAVGYFAKRYSPADMFAGKSVLDIGCGAGGKSLYYASLGARMVTGVDVCEQYRRQSLELAKELNLSDKFRFIVADASSLPFNGGCFDTVIMNDAMEHVRYPEKTLTEGLRVLKRGGRLFINFPPYFHPYGAHMSDAICIPWVHMLFPESSLIKAYKQLVAELPDGMERVRLRFSTLADGREVNTYINKMTLGKFKGILKKTGITPEYYAEIPLHPFLSVAAKLPVIKEPFVKMVVCVVRKA